MGVDDFRMPSVKLLCGRPSTACPSRAFLKSSLKSSSLLIAFTSAFQLKEADEGFFRSL